VGRGDLVSFLEGRKIETRMIFSGNILRQPAYRGAPHRVSGSLEQTDVIMNRSFFVGVYPGLTPAMLDYMVRSFDDFFRRGARR
jgi:CDP-6-deoxy-D-xylo-4-hexulose-3-dehydrase